MKRATTEARGGGASQVSATAAGLAQQAENLRHPPGEFLNRLRAA